MGLFTPPVRADLTASLVVTYAVAAEHLDGVVAQGLEADLYDGWGMIAISLCRIQNMRPAFLPRWCGMDGYRIGYHLFVRDPRRPGPAGRGLQTLRWMTDRRRLLLFGNLAGGIPYQLAQVETSRDAVSESTTFYRAQHREGHTVFCEDYAQEHPLPPESPFANWSTARRYSGYLPLTFIVNARGQIVRTVEETLRAVEPKPAALLDARFRYMDSPLWKGTPKLACAFRAEAAPVLWRTTTA